MVDESFVQDAALWFIWIGYTPEEIIDDLKIDVLVRRYVLDNFEFMVSAWEHLQEYID